MKRSFLTIVRRTMLIGISFILVVLIGTAGYQGVLTAADKRNYPPQGDLVDIGGYRLHIVCKGEGQPTVLLESASDMMSSDWYWVQETVAHRTKVCAYDRAGVGWSDAGPAPRDALQVSKELRLLTQKARINGPLILVGHSVGALYVQQFASDHPESVAGLVLVDPGHPDMFERVPGFRTQAEQDEKMVSTLQTLSYFGVPRLLGVGKANAQGLPEQQAGEIQSRSSLPKHWKTLA